MSRADWLYWRKCFYTVYVCNKWIPWWERLPKIGYWLWCKRFRKERHASKLVKKVMES